MSARAESLRHIFPIPGAPHKSGRVVLNVPEWRIDDGEQALLRGISGSGKTTFFNILSGILPPAEGRIWLDEQDIYSLSVNERDRLRRWNVGYVFQNHYLLPSLTAFENVMMPMEFAGKIGKEKRRERARSLLAALGLAEFENHRPVQLSAGQRLRVAVARALSNKPRLLLADEPTAALDEQNALVVMDCIQQACHEHGSSLLVASHDPALEKRFTQTLRLKSGQLQQENAPHDV
jgi:ABC-type lipoprotein export system ATPase subunit